MRFVGKEVAGRQTTGCGGEKRVVMYLHGMGPWGWVYLCLFVVYTRAVLTPEVIHFDKLMRMLYSC